MWHQSLFSMEKMFSFHSSESFIYQLPLVAVKKFDMPESNVTDRTLVQSPSKVSLFSQTLFKRCFLDGRVKYIPLDTWNILSDVSGSIQDLLPRFQIKQETIWCEIMFMIQKSNCVSKLEAGIWSMLNSSSQPTIPLMIQYAVNNQAAGCYNQSDTNFQANKFMRNLFFLPPIDMVPLRLCLSRKLILSL